MAARNRAPDSLERLLGDLRRGLLGPGEARKALARLAVREVSGRARLDLLRHHRTGAPEAVMGQNKRPQDVARLLREMVRHNGVALATRVTPAGARAARRALRGFQVTHHPEAGVLLVRRKDLRPAPRGRVGILTAGTSDIPVAEEAALTLEAMGVGVERAYDVGVAGIHRLYGPLEEMSERVDALIVVAGMEGVLPSVVAGLVDVPVVGVPARSGYGAGGEGLGALLTMLQSCSPGLTVVNIGNGFGAAVAAGRVALRASGRGVSRGARAAGRASA
ncbi:MAG: nickel pincer cofactor biosynthesis protein LarB [Halobacteria archaeon]